MGWGCYCALNEAALTLCSLTRMVTGGKTTNSLGSRMEKMTSRGQGFQSDLMTGMQGADLRIRRVVLQALQRTCERPGLGLPPALTRAASTGTVNHYSGPRPCRASLSPCGVSLDCQLLTSNTALHQSLTIHQTEPLGLHISWDTRLSWFMLDLGDCCWRVESSLAHLSAVSHYLEPSKGPQRGDLGALGFNPNSTCQLIKHFWHFDFLIFKIGMWAGFTGKMTVSN